MTENKVQLEMREAISKVIQDNAETPADRGVIVEFIVVVEIIGDDGGQWLKMVSGDGTHWHKVGMLMSVTDDLRNDMQQGSHSED